MFSRETICETLLNHFEIMHGCNHSFKSLQVFDFAKKLILYFIIKLILMNYFLLNIYDLSKHNFELINRCIIRSSWFQNISFEGIQSWTLLLLINDNITLLLLLQLLNVLDITLKLNDVIFLIIKDFLELGYLLSNFISLIEHLLLNGCSHFIYSFWEWMLLI